MKKVFTQAFVFAVCFTAVIGCHKEVKNPVDKVPASNAKSTTTTTTATYTGTQTTTQNQSGHTCGHSQGSGPH